MSLNIKNPETHRLARDLALLTGETVTEAVTVAVRERLERIRSDSRGSLADQLVSIGRDCAARLREPYASIEHGQFLYDDRGLPK